MYRILGATLISLAVAGCGAAAGPVACAADTPAKELTCEDITLEEERLAVSSEEINQRTCPSTIGTFKGTPVVEQWVCSDVCPDAGGVIVVFDDVDEAECEQMGQEPMYDPAWGGYRGCRPACARDDDT